MKRSKTGPRRLQGDPKTLHSCPSTRPKCWFRCRHPSKMSLGRGLKGDLLPKGFSRCFWNIQRRLQDPQEASKMLPRCFKDASKRFPRRPKTHLNFIMYVILVSTSVFIVFFITLCHIQQTFYLWKSMKTVVVRDHFYVYSVGSCGSEIYQFPCHRRNSEQGQSLPWFISFLAIDAVVELKASPCSFSRFMTGSHIMCT